VNNGTINVGTVGTTQTGMVGMQLESDAKSDAVIENNGTINIYVINTAQGWPVYYSYWSGSNSTSFSSGAKVDFYYAVDLADGSRR
ncbi:hypothetical protein MJL27_25745, partial [Salmonella enterica subsp. enterica serovar Anatum]|nr:hypothetical protein [Salmonella enterica subsp. enterica serovar Anatum]